MKGTIRWCGLGGAIVGLAFVCISIYLRPVHSHLSLSERMLISGTSNLEGDLFLLRWYSIASVESHFLSDLEESASHTVAISAAWERARRELLRQHVLKQSETSRFTPAAAQVFCAVVENRLQTKVPTWWLDTMTRASLDPNEVNLVFNPDELICKNELCSAGQSNNAQSASTASNSSVIIAELSPEIVEEFTRRGQADCIALYRDGDRCFCAFFSGRARPYEICCFECSSGKLIWKSRVSAGGDAVDRDGYGFHKVELRATSKEICVFGASDDCVYIERFSALSGAKTMRFCSNTGLEHRLSLSHPWE